MKKVQFLQTIVSTKPVKKFEKIVGHQIREKISDNGEIVLLDAKTNIEIPLKQVSFDVQIE